MVRATVFADRLCTIKPIAFDARLISALGVGRYISGLLPPLAELLGDRLTVISRARDVALVRALLGAGPRVVVGEAPAYRLAEQITLLFGILRLNAALVHFPHYNHPLAYPGRFVVTIHDLFPFQFPEIHSGPVPRTVNQLLIRGAIRRAAAIITPSRATASELARRFPRCRRRIVPIAEAADPRFHSKQNLTAEVAWQAHLKIRPPYVLYLGQWKPYKNVPLLIQAFKEVVRRIPEAQLVLGGHDPRHPEVPNAASELPPGSVVLPGRLPDDAVADLYRGAAAVVLPSRAEGFGLPVIEAMACGTRVVCSDLPVLREIADGVAIFCDPDDPGSFARGIMRALRPPEGDRSRELGLARAQTFSWRRAAEDTVRVYEGVLDST